MKRKLLLSVSVVVWFCILGVGTLFPASDSISDYGHISFIDKSATVIRQDNTEQAAEINLPIAPGDQVVTGADGRCEIQFDNGTVLRLDKNTRLTVTTILAPTITTQWKVTTLHLNQGQIYPMIQSYNREMFQVITPNAAIDFKQRSAATIRLSSTGDTFIFTDKGKCRVMFGEDVNSYKTETARSGNGYMVSSSQGFSTTSEKPDLEFTAWNEYVNNHFKDLHAGISNVPAQITRFSKGLVYWAEKWSSMYGQWVYDDLFGYVWKPSDEIFAFSKRPFFHANFTRVNGELFLVPQQAWGWIPAHLGTWVWMKWGWTWIPGNAFSTGIGQMNASSQFLTLDYWIYNVYGNYDLYYDYRMGGNRRWRQNYRQTFGKDAPKMDLKRLPASVRGIINAMNNAPVTTIQSKLGTNRPTPVFDSEKLAPYLKNISTPRTTGQKEMLHSPRKSVLAINPMAFYVNPQPSIEKSRGIKGMAVRASRDFNPDIKWGESRGYAVHYSSKLNAMVCPSLNIDSKTMTPLDRYSLFNRMKYDQSYNRGSSSSSSSSYAGNTSATGTSAPMDGNANASKNNTSIEHKEKQ